MKAWTANPPAKESTANNAASRATVGRDRSRGRGGFTPGPGGTAAAEDSTAGDSRVAMTAPISPMGTRTRNHWRPAVAPIPLWLSNPGRPAASAPSEPATAATALYTPNARVRRADEVVAGSMACSRDVKGPDSTTSVESVPASAATKSAQNAV